MHSSPWFILYIRIRLSSVELRPEWLLNKEQLNVDFMFIDDEHINTIKSKLNIKHHNMKK